MPQKIRETEKLPVVFYRKLSFQTYEMSMEGKLMGKKYERQILKSSVFSFYTDLAILSAALKRELFQSNIFVY